MGYESTYAGALSYLRRPYSKDVSAYDLIVSGVPYDLAVTNRPGARFGPRGIRAASAQLAWDGSNWPWASNPFKHQKVCDYGDCWVDHGYPDKIPDQIQEHTRHVISGGAKSVIMGGDHFITYPILKAINEVHGPVSLVHFDAHSDTWEEPDERIDHGTMFFHAARNGLVVPEKSVQIGMRTWNPESHGFNVMDANLFIAMESMQLLKRLFASLGRTKHI